MTSRTQDDDVEYDSFDDRLRPSWRPRAMEVSDLGLWADLR